MHSEAKAALARLRAGNARYVAGDVEARDGHIERRKKLAGGQQPFAVVLGCADSRVPPELVFDQWLGELFVIRVAGNIPSPEVSGSVEYAVDHLDVPLVVVLGHTSCGAVTATVDGYEAEGDIRTLVEAIKPAVEDARKHPGDDLLGEAIRRNVERGVEALIADEPVLARAHRESRVAIVAALYDLATGKVAFGEDGRLPRGESSGGEQSG